MSDAAAVLSRLQLQQEKYREMARLVADQHAVFASVDVDAILGLIERKRAILAEVGRLDAELAPIKAEWPRIRATFSTQETQEIRAILDETQRVLQDLVRLEDEGRACLEQRRSAGAAALDLMIQKSRARGAYGSR